MSFQICIEIIEAIAGIIAIIGLPVAIYQYMKNRKRENQIATIDAYARLQNEAFDPLNKWMPGEIREAMVDNKSDAYKELSGYLARIEVYCAGLVAGIYDFDTFYSIASGYFEEKAVLGRRLLPMLESKLGNADKDYFHNIHKVWEKMNCMSQKQSQRKEQNP